MRKFSLRFTMIVLMIATIAFSAAAPALAEDTFILSPDGSYEYVIATQQYANGIMIINTKAVLTNGKEAGGNTEALCSDKKEYAKSNVCNALGQTVYGQLMKLNDVAQVGISYRQIAVRKYPIPKDWKATSDAVLDVLDRTLVGAGKKGGKK